MTRKSKPVKFITLVTLLGILALMLSPAIGVALTPTPRQSHSVALVPGPGGQSGGAGYMPTHDTYLVQGFNSFNFSNLAVADVSSSSLANFDTVVMLQIAYPKTVFTPAQQADINQWVSNGGKLIIYDSDATSGPDYSWLMYPFTANVPGQTGSSGGSLNIVENNTLSSADSTSPYYIDTGAITATTDAVGDANVIVTKDSHWYGDMQATNVNNVTGWVHTYASYGHGLVIYNGLDSDYLGGSLGLQKIWLFELQQQWDPSDLGNTVPVSGNTPGSVQGFGSLASPGKMFNLGVSYVQGAPAPTGQVSYSDTMSSPAVKFNSTQITSLVIDSATKQATIKGQAKFNGTNGHEFELVVKDGNQLQGKGNDSFALSVDGTQVVSNTLTGGNIWVK